MHITLIISSLAPGGAERVLSELANSWVLRGHKITMVTFGAQEVPPLYSLVPEIELIHLNQVTRETPSLLGRLKNIVKRIIKLRKLVKKVKPDIIISFLDVVNVTTLLATRRLGIPIIVSERTHPQYYQLPGFYKQLRRITYLYADKVISQTSSASRYFSNLAESKKAVIPNSVKKPEGQKTEADLLKPVQKIISVGRLCPYKGFSSLICAFGAIVKQSPELTLTIYGEGEDRQNLEALIIELDLKDSVRLPGIIQDVNGALSQADLFVFPSHYEGFPNALCEAMAMGLPVIASNCSGNIDIIREGIDGRLFGVGDGAQLIRLIKELMDDAPQRVKLSQGALELPDRFSEPTVLQMWDKVLADVVGP